MITDDVCRRLCCAQVLRVTPVTAEISLCTQSTCSLQTVSLTGNANLPGGESLIHVLHMCGFSSTCDVFDMSLL